MPSRVLRDYSDSILFDGISADAERLFIRLIMKADDYGRYHADPRLVRAGCFPLCDNLRTNDLTRWLDELSHRQLILRYEIAGRHYLAISKFGQRLRAARAKFPPPAGKGGDFLLQPDTWEQPADICPQVAAIVRKPPPDSDSDSGSDSDLEAAKPRAAAVRRHTGALLEVLAYFASEKLPESDARWFFAKCEGNGWTNAGRAIKDWRATVRSWKHGGYLPSQKQGGRGTGPVVGTPIRPDELPHIMSIEEVMAQDEALKKHA